MIQVYRWIVWPILKTAFFWLRFFNPKIARGWSMRQANSNLKFSWQDGPAHRQPVWFHCASGEFEYAKPVLERFRKSHPDISTLVTFFSPSVESAVRNSKLVDIAVPMPWDTPCAWSQFFEHHRPCMLLIARTDTWPEMLWQAHQRHIPSLLFSATLTQSSGRARGLARPISKWIFSMLTQIFCVSEADFECFRELDAGEKTQVAGDTRFDQVQTRLQNPKPLSRELLHPTLPRLIAGSTWPEDENVLLQVLPKFKNQLQWILVPHEPTVEHLLPIEKSLDAMNFTHARYSQSATANVDHKTRPDALPEVLIVDQIGILAELYAVGNFAFVGGSYRKTVHSVMEPLAAGCLTLVGPKIQNNREAIEFSKIGLQPLGDFTAVEVCANAAEMTEVLEQTLSSFTHAASERIRTEIQMRSNKSQLVLEWIESHLNPTRSTTRDQ